MFSFLLLSRQNILHNLQVLKSHCNGRICAMVKANGYGHGLEEVVSILSGHVEAFGVANIQEALQVRKVDKLAQVIIFGICEDIESALKNNISLSIISVNSLKNIIKTSKKLKIKPNLHLNINTGMNRFGIKSEDEFFQVIKILKSDGIDLQGIFTHFSSLTTDLNYTYRQKQRFDFFVSKLPNDCKPVLYVGGGNSIFKFDGYDMYRVGMLLYGYGGANLQPVLSVNSRVVALQDVKKGEHVGYMNSFCCERDMRVGVVPVGYADGIKRGLSNCLFVQINGRLLRNVGNICMDCFMVEVDKSVKVGDKVLVMQNATDWAEKLDTTEYEILTNLNSFRGERIIK